MKAQNPGQVLPPPIHITPAGRRLSPMSSSPTPSPSRFYPLWNQAVIFPASLRSLHSAGAIEKAQVQCFIVDKPTRASLIKPLTSDPLALTSTDPASHFFSPPSWSLDWANHPQHSRPPPSLVPRGSQCRSWRQEQPRTPPSRYSRIRSSALRHC